MKKIHYAWIMVVATCLMTLGMGAQLMSASVFLLPISKSFNVSITMVSVVYSMALIVHVLASPLCASLFKRYSIKHLLCFFLFGQICSLLLYSFSTNIYVMFVAGVLEGCCVSCFIYVMPSVIVEKWFRDRGELVLGMYITASVLGGSLFTPIANSIIYSLGWRTAYRSLAVYVLIIGIPMAILFVKGSPEEIGIKPYENHKNSQAVKKRRHSVGGAGITVRSAFHKKEFYLTALYLIATQYCVGIQNHLANYVLSLGFSTAVSATFASVCFMGGLVSRIGLSIMNELTGVRKSTFVCGFIGIIGSLILCFYKSPTILMLYVLGFLFGCALKSGLIETSAMCYEVFGASEDYSRINANIVFAGGLINATSNAVVAYIFDSTGSYNGAFIMISILFALAIVLANILLGGRNRKLNVYED